ncbi:MAG: polyphosphate kinase 2 family protein [Planctomycetes bacterium]|nr:polyphosphate kinase 2 family protein [Planctomycetota bacterium]
MSRASDFADKFKVTKGKDFRLKDWDPADTLKFNDKEQAERILAEGVEKLAKLQDKLYADDRWSLLLIFQAMDAAGKDGTIKHVMSGINPQGCQVYSFKSPSAEELDHDFLWRTTRCLPERGRIGIFNRSYYEEVLVVRVHPEFLEKQRMPRKLVDKDIWEGRYESINDFEKHLSRNGTIVRKFFLNVSKDEQKARFMKRLDDPDRNWKFSSSDAKERQHWDEYQAAYQDLIRATASKHAPWYVVPADHKWFSRVVVAAAIIDALESLNLDYPEVDAAKKAELAEARKLLDGEKKRKS